MINKEKAQQDFDMLKTEFKELKGDDNSLKMYHVLLKHFKGFNVMEDELFDFDYKHLTATIVRNEGVIKLSGNVDFYESDGYSPDNFSLSGIS